MAGKMLRASPLSVSAVVVVVAISTLAFFATKHSADQQNKALLQNDTDQGAVLASSILGNLASAINPIATGISLSNGSIPVFESEAKALAGAGGVVFARQENGHYVVLGAAGHGFTTGQVLTGSVAATVARATATVTPGPVVRAGDHATVGFAVGPPLVPLGDAIYVQVTLDPFTATPVTAGKPFAALRVALYGSRSPDPGNLFVATTRQLPLTGPVARAPVTVGSATWTLEAEARAPLAGSFAAHAPLFILLLGILVALVVGATVEILVRRQRYAAELVAQRTGDLERSLRELREAQDALVRGERLSALGEMASVIGHELRNPLTAVTNALFLIRHEVGEPVSDSLETHLAMAERETDKAATLASDLTAFVRPRDPVLEDIALGDVVHEVIQSTPPPAGVLLSQDVPPITVVADRLQMAEVVTNLLTNAYQALPDGGSVRVGVRDNGTAVVLSVEDDGPGIDDVTAARLFEPFFTTKPNGTGLGLAIVRRVVEAHGGTITVENVDPHGARIEVGVPSDVRAKVRA